MLEFCVREHLNAHTPRVMAVLDPIKVVIENYPEGQVEEFDMVCKTIITAFNESVPAFYSAEDVQRGYIEGKSRSNAEERFPLMSLTIVGVRANNYQSSFDLARAAACLKKNCKRIAGSNFQLED